MGACYGTVWMVGLALTPYLLSRAIDDGLVPGRAGALLAWAAVLLGAGALVAAVSILRHRTLTPAPDGRLVPDLPCRAGPGRAPGRDAGRSLR